MLNFFVLFLVIGLNYGSEVSIIGVPPSKLLLYQPNKDFTCFDGSKSIPFNSVNDDFCDCADGSDEPGTSACASSIFFCPNNGYYSLNIPSSRVNDGICDCCDGSDEYLLKNCSDICDALGAQAVAEAERVAELMNRGNSLRLQMSSSGKQIRQQKQERLIELTKELNEAEKLRNEAEEMKKNAELKENAALDVYRIAEEKERAAAAEKQKEADEEEAKAVFMSMDTDGNALLVPQELINKVRTLKSCQSKTDVDLEEEIQFMMNSKSELKFKDFLEDVWDKLRALMALETTVTDCAEDCNDQHEQDDIAPEPEPQAEPEHVDEEEEEVEEDKNEEEEEGPDKEHEDTEEKYGPQPPPDKTIEYDEETKRLMEQASRARQHLEEADRSFKDIERDISGLKEFLEKDFGPDDEFLSLEGQCFSFSDREYNYKLCPFDQVVQSGKHGGSETRLGTWKSWENPGSFDIMIYDRGQSCWNGPQRSAKVYLSCGLENEVISAAEPNKCEYVLEFRTPSACRPAQKQSKDNVIRDEL